MTSSLFSLAYLASGSEETWHGIPQADSVKEFGGYFTQENKTTQQDKESAFVWNDVLPAFGHSGLNTDKEPGGFPGKGATTNARVP
jgi:hypothetical protein